MSATKADNFDADAVQRFKAIPCEKFPFFAHWNGAVVCIPRETQALDIDESAGRKAVDAQYVTDSGDGSNQELWPFVTRVLSLLRVRCYTVGVSDRLHKANLGGQKRCFTFFLPINVSSCYLCRFIQKCLSSVLPIPLYTRKYCSVSPQSCLIGTSTLQKQVPWVIRWTACVWTETCTPATEAADVLIFNVPNWMPPRLRVLTYLTSTGILEQLGIIKQLLTFH
jgi:hypothetical protein